MGQNIYNHHLVYWVPFLQENRLLFWLLEDSEKIRIFKIVFYGILTKIRNVLTCRLTTKFFTPSITKDEPWDNNLENIPIVLVPPPTAIWFDDVVILAYILRNISKLVKLHEVHNMLNRVIRLNLLPAFNIIYGIRVATCFFEDSVNFIDFTLKLKYS